jgi:pimeloyl-ACP methyl ester carboxylesterase
VVNVDAPPNIEPFVAQLQSMSAQIHGPDFPVVWARMEQTFRTDLLPPDVRDLVARNSRPRQEIVVSYWQELLDQSPKQISASISDAMADLAAAGVPYLLVLGSDPTPDLPELLSAYLPYSTLEVWAGTGHFPHLAHPRRFAARLTATGGWPTRSLLHAEAAL